MFDFDTTVTLRPFTPADQFQTKALILQGLCEHFGFIDPTLNPDLDDIQASYVNNGGVFVVAEIGNDLAGAGALIPETAVSGRIVRVSVQKFFRRLGIGRLITEYLINAGRQHGYTQILVETNEDWFAAIRLYKQCGFREVERRAGEIHMALTLKSA